MKVSINVNETSYERDVEPRTLLVDFIRDEIGLTGTNIGCDTSSCGACTLHLNGEAIKSCTMLAIQAVRESQPGHAYAAVVPAFLAAPITGRPLVVHGDGRQSRDFTYVDDIARGTLLATRKKVGFDTFNLGSDTPTLRQLTGALEEAAGRRDVDSVVLRLKNARLGRTQVGHRSGAQADVTDVEDATVASWAASSLTFSICPGVPEGAGAAKTSKRRVRLPSGGRKMRAPAGGRSGDRWGGGRSAYPIPTCSPRAVRCRGG